MSKLFIRLLAFQIITMFGAPSSFASGARPADYSFSVEKSGHGPAMILIPGLYCSGDVWKETVAHYKDHYTCYSLTLPGFAGQAPIHADTLLTAITRDIARFIVQNHLQKPLVVGHSLGGWVALDLAVENPGLLGGVICVSSAP